MYKETMRNFLIFLSTLFKSRTLQALHNHHNKATDLIAEAIDRMDEAVETAIAHEDKTQQQVAALASTIADLKSANDAVQEKADKIAQARVNLADLVN